jgi:tetratricopeptide (TPR) repeat protein
MGDLDSARRCLYESLEIHEEIGNAAGIATSLLWIALIAQGEDRGATAINCCERSLSLYRSINDRLGLAVAASQFGNILIQQGALDAAEPVLLDGLAIAREYGNGYLVVEILVAMGSLEQARGRRARAREFRSEALRSVRGTTSLTAQARSLEQLAVQAQFEQRPALAAFLLGVLSGNCPEFAASSRNAGRLEQLEREIRKLAGQERFGESWARGRSAVWLEAIEEALLAPD